MWLQYNQQLYHYISPSKTGVSHPFALAKKICCLFIFFISSFYFPALSQKQHLKFEHIGTDMGLSQSSVQSIFQDSRGFMWFGTSDGLNKYDGYKFTVYKYNAADKNSLSNNNIHDISEDADGNLWVATWGGSLNLFDWKKEKFTRFIFNAKDPSAIGKDYICKLLRDSEGNLWIGTEGGGLNLYDKKNNNFIHYVHDKNDPQSLSDDWVKDLTEDAGHNLWIATKNGGLNLFNKKTKTFRRFQHDDKNSKSLSSDYNWTLFTDSKNQLWIGTHDEGLNLFDRENEEFIHFKMDTRSSNSLQSNVINVITEDEEGHIWVGTENGGLSIFNPATGTFENHLQDDADNTSLTNNTILSIHKDAKGNMWTGTFSGGINFASSDASKFIHYRHTSSPSSLSNNNVLSIFEDSKENLWIGTDGGGLNLFDNKTGTFTSYKHDPLNSNSICGNYILKIFEDRDGNLWIGTWGDGVTVFNKEKNTYKHFKYDLPNKKGLPGPDAWTIAEDADKNIWIGTYGGGLSQYDRKNNSFITYHLDETNASGIHSDYINTIYSDKEGNLWIGTNGSGLDLFNKKTKTFTHFVHDNNKNSISDDDINCIAEDSEGNLWLGTGDGLDRIDGKTKRITSCYVKDGLPGNSIMGLLFDKKGNLWISTFNGLSRFNRVAKTFKNFDINDGLQSNEFKMNSCFLSRSGKMYFGGINGLNSFFPENIKERKYDPPIVFTSFHVFNKAVPISEKGKSSVLLQSITDTRELILSYDQSVISFEFASLNYVSENKKRYSYRMEGFDIDWNDIGTRHTATYTNLNPGTYTFKVRGLNNEGGWSSTIASLELVISPPYWLTWWFRTAVFLVIAGSAVAFFIVKINVEKRQQKLLEYKVKEQTVQLVTLHDEEHKARLEAEKAWKEAEKSKRAANNANEKLERKNKELEQFVYIASHDLREPLRTTTSFVELFQKQFRGKLDEKADSYLFYIQQATGRMKKLITDLLDYSRIDNKKEFELVDCNSILREVLTDLGAALSESGGDIRADRLPVITAYPTGIKQLFQNLIVNGIKFRKKEEPPRIEISAKSMDDCWQFAFKDNGIGIEEKNKERIFLMFQRLHTRNEYEGSGIGLAFCKKIVEMHNGRIWIDANNREGTTFYFTICNTTNA